MNCRECRVEIEELDGRAPLRAVSPSAAAHLQSCRDCVAFREERATLSQMIGSLEVVDAPADFDFRLRARLAGLRSERQSSVGWNRFAPGAWPLALAATLVILITVGFLTRQMWLSPSSNPVSKDVTAGRGDNDQLPLTVPSNSPLPINNGRESTPPSSPPVVAQSPKNIVNTPSASKRIAVHKRRTNAQEPGTKEDVLDSDFTNFAADKSRMPPGIPDPMTQPSALVAVPVEASLKPATILVDDGRAKPQMLSIKPVTFGAQDLFEQGVLKKTFISAGQSVW